MLRIAFLNTYSKNGGRTPPIDFPLPGPPGGSKIHYGRGRVKGSVLDNPPSAAIAWPLT